MPNTSGIQVFGSFAFTGKFTGNAYADFLLGLPATVTRLEPFPAQYNRFRDWSGYAQDDFKVTPRLTLMYGLRWEYNGPAYAAERQPVLLRPRDRQDRGAQPAVAQKLFSPYFPTTFPVETADQIGTGRSLRKADKNNFAPRFGFSYQLDNARQDRAARRLGHLLFALLRQHPRRSVARTLCRHHRHHQQHRQRRRRSSRWPTPSPSPARRARSRSAAVTPEPAEQLRPAVQPLAGARTHPRHRPARQLHRLQGHAAGLPPRCQSAGRLHRRLQQRAPSLSALQQHQLRRQRRQHALQRTADRGAEALQPAA